jgi:hypothetical protein
MLNRTNYKNKVFEVYCSGNQTRKEVVASVTKVVASVTKVVASVTKV